MDNGGEWSPIPYVFYLGSLGPLMIFVSAVYFIMDGTATYHSYANLTMSIPAFYFFFSPAYTYCGGEMYRLPDIEITGSADDIAEDLSEVLSITRVRWHWNMLFSMGGPVYRIDGDRRKEMTIHVYRTKRRLNVWLSRGGKEYKETIEDRLRRA
jgi:hypothetical protein